MVSVLREKGLCDAVGAEELKSFRNVEEMQAVASDYATEPVMVNDSAPANGHHVHTNGITPTMKVEETTKIVNKVTSEIVDEQFIRNAIDLCSINALRLALYQATGDSSLAEMKVSKEPIRGGAMLDYVVSKDDEDLVKKKALDFLLKQEEANNTLSGCNIDARPDLEQSSTLMRLFTGEDMAPAELQLGFEELATSVLPTSLDGTSARLFILVSVSGCSLPSTLTLVAITVRYRLRLALNRPGSR